MFPELLSNRLSQILSHVVRPIVLSTQSVLTAFLDLDAELPVMDSDIAVCAYESARILFYAFYIGAAKFSLTADLVSEMAEICLPELKKLARTSSMIEKIVSITCSYSQITQLTATKQADIASLIARGFSSQSSESISASPERSQQRDQTSPISATAASRKILSQHSLVKHSRFVDDSARLVMKSNLSGRSPRSSLRKRSDVSATPAALSATNTTPPNTASNGVVGTQQVNSIESRAPEQSQSAPIMETGWGINNAYQEAWMRFPQALTPSANSKTTGELSTFSNLNTGCRVMVTARGRICLVDSYSPSEHSQLHLCGEFYHATAKCPSCRIKLLMFT